MFALTCVWRTLHPPRPRIARVAVVQSDLRSPLHRVRDWHPDCLLQGKEGLRNPREVSLALVSAVFLPRPMSRLDALSPYCTTVFDENGAGKLFPFFCLVCLLVSSRLAFTS